MAKTKISEFSANPANNTDIDNINIAEGCAPSGINDAIRELMAQLKDFQVGSAGDSFNGPVGTTTAAAGAFTTLSATGVTTVQAGTSSAPAITTSGDTNTGIFFPAADTIAFTEGGAEAMRIDSSGNVLIGTTTQISKLTVAGGIALSGGAGVSGNAFYPYYNSATSYNAIGSDNNGGMTFITGVTSPSVRATIDNSGNLLVGTTSAGGKITSNTGANGGAVYARFSGGSGNSNAYTSVYDNTTGTAYGAVFFYNGLANQPGQITYTSTTVSYTSNSDYRLKNTIAPMTGALEKVALLKPCTYKWNADGSNGQGFIAHELQEVVPDAVTGEKDAVNEDGSIKPQGIDTSFLVATLTAAIQEQQAIITALTARVAALETAATSQPE